MKKCMIIFLAMLIACMTLTADVENPENFEVYFDTSDVPESVRFGFTTSSVVPAVANDNLSELELVDRDGKPMTLVGSNAENSIYIFWEVLSSKNFTIDIFSSPMAIANYSGAGELDFTATTTSYTNSIKDSDSNITLNSSNEYGVGEGNLKHIYTHEPSTGTIANSGTTPIQFVTEDAARMHGIGKWTTNVTLRYMSK